MKTKKSPKVAKKVWFLSPGPQAFGRIEWDAMDAEAARDGAAIIEARKVKVKRPPSRHGY